MVIVMIGVMAALATPTFINVMRDRRVSQGALRAAEVFRLARSHALGRGSAVMVTWTEAAAGEGSLLVREATELGTNLPANNCTTNNWNNPPNARQLVLVLFAKGDFGLAEFTMSDSSGPLASADICFSPRGRAFYRTTGGWAPLAEVPKFEVTNSKTGMKRFIYVPPNGVARLVL